MCRPSSSLGQVSANASGIDNEGNSDSSEDERIPRNTGEAVISLKAYAYPGTMERPSMLPPAVSPRGNLYVMFRQSLHKELEVTPFLPEAS